MNMTNDERAALLHAHVKSWLHEHPDRGEIHPKAFSDVARHMTALGVLEVIDGTLRSRAGGGPADLLVAVRQQSPFLFRTTAEPTAAPTKAVPQKRATPDVSTPALAHAARMRNRASATEKLERSNGV